ncbi:hypothetical protein CWM47_03650 [Spirosoma pollinicola]|uniref:Uncharacterized protein n=1 Tax=Spirosoma pollinicola TaxID=2057025 RepID=A0A2K8YTP8_9BACT|nr:hypothetical protein CWM47_03650 [Spirosoma pollinicola]
MFLIPRMAFLVCNQHYLKPGKNHNGNITQPNSSTNNVYLRLLNCITEIEDRIAWLVEYQLYLYTQWPVLFFWMRLKKA